MLSIFGKESFNGFQKGSISTPLQISEGQKNRAAIGFAAPQKQMLFPSADSIALRFMDFKRQK